MVKNYYCLVASLREYALDGDHKGFNAPEVVSEIIQELDPKDQESIKLLYTYYDIENLLALKGGRKSFNPLGNISKDDLTKELDSPELLPKQLQEVIRGYSNHDEMGDFNANQKIESALMECYYNLCEKSKCTFIQNWGRFDRNLKNVCAAYTARRLKIAIADVVVGDGYVVDALTRSSAADFGLKGELEYLDDVMGAMGDDVNLVEKEQRIDNIRWNMSDELTPFDYFNVNTILAYLVKVNIIYRWTVLDRQQGELMLRKLIASFDGKELIANAENENN